MPALTIRHVTTYRYRHPVAFGEHRMMLRPRDSHDQKVIEATLGITPEPSSLRFDRDAFGNHVAVAEFAAKATELSFESVVSLEHSPSNPADIALEEGVQTFPVDYNGHGEPDLGDCLRRRHADPDDQIGRWARQFLDDGAPISALALLTRLSRGIHRQFTYRRREAKGIQSPAETFRLGHGSCRDFAWLMVEAARALGLAARFASGYLAVAVDEAPDGADGGPHGATHAWAQAYLPGAGWIDFDPTSGSVGKSALVTVAVVGDPADALPLHGTFIGSASDPLGMEVQVSVTSRCAPNRGTD
jgi:transglutaminase-like putative cysteine protease